MRESVLARGSIRRLRARLAGVFVVLTAAYVADADDKEDFQRLNEQFGAQHAAGQYREAEQTALKMQQLAQGALSENQLYMAEAAARLGRVLRSQGRYAEAEPLFRRSLKIKESALGSDHPSVAVGLNGLAWLYQYQGRYAEAEPLFKRSLEIDERKLGPDHPETGTALSDLAFLYQAEGRYAEAEPLFKRGLEIHQKKLGPDHPRTATTLIDLAWLYHIQGRFAEAEVLIKRSIEIREKKLGAESAYTAHSVNNLGTLYRDQGRYAEAEPLYQRSLAIREKNLGPDHPDTAVSLNNLALLYQAQGRYAEAEPLFKRGLESREKTLGPDHPATAQSLNYLASFYLAQSRYAAAEPLFQRSLQINEAKLGPDHPSTAGTLQNLAVLYYAQDRLDDAESLTDRAIGIRDRAGLAPGKRFESYLLRARISWKRDRRSEAMRDLQQAMQLAEQQRSRASGSELERAESFGNFGEAFEQVLAWQLELRDASEALDAMERAHARSLLDEMQQSGVDLNSGRSPAEREDLKARELELKEQVARREKELEALEKNPSLSPEAKRQRAGEIQVELGKARTALYEFYRDLRGSSPVYRNLLSAGSGPPRLSQVQRQLVGREGLLLAYLLGQENGYLLVVGFDKAELTTLRLDEQTAQSLEVKAGPLTANLLGETLTNQQNTGVLQLLRDPRRAERATGKLAALWQVLIPPAYREALSAGKIKRLMVLPDGQLALLPFETLVVRSTAPVQYLLDVGPPIHYGPSAAVLYNLAQRTPAKVDEKREPILSVANPDYSGRSQQRAAPPDQILGQVAVSSRYRALGGRLAPLPYTGWESAWVAEAFKKAGLSTRRLEGAEATKARLCAEAAGRRILHLACHGLAEQSHGNLFGALAFTPGLASSEDDGFLTLREIYQLNLRSCELTILSACETNCGPQQQGEGVWTLSRGFLVAGTQRVVASNWLVDDEAAATLISYFCTHLAEAQKQRQPAGYAEALQRAKRGIRRQEKWQSPYYWAALVLVGPE